MAATSFGAITAKTRVMYGRMLTSNDYEQLLSKNSVADIISYLKTETYYSNILKNVLPEHCHRGNVENILESSMMDEYVKIAKQINGKEAKLFKLICSKFEINYLLQLAMSFVKSTWQGNHLNVPEFIIKHSDIDFKKLLNVTSFDGLIDTLQGTDYYPFFKNISKNENGQYDITSVEISLHSFYFERLYKAIKKDIPKDSQKFFMDLIGSETDLKNIIRIMRIKKNFDYSKEQIYAFLIPVNHKIKKQDISNLVDSKNYEEFTSLLKNTKYDKLFYENDFEYPEEYFYEYNYRLCKKIMKTGAPSMNIPIAYLWLKEFEIRNIVNIIEACRYNLPSEETCKHLIGVNRF